MKFIATLLVVFNLCFYGLAYGEDSFSFAGISWNDPYDAIEEKINNFGFTEIVSTREELAYGISYNHFDDTMKIIKPLESIFDLSDNCPKSRMFLSLQAFATDDLRKKLGTSQIDLIFFSSNNKRSLLFYGLDIVIDHLDDIRNILINKYGKPQEYPMPEGYSKVYIWKKGVELLVLSTANRDLYYINSSHIQNVNQQCIEITSKSNKSSTESKKNAF